MSQQFRRAQLRALGVLLACCALAATALMDAGGVDRADPAAAVVQAARGHLGDRYQWGATGPETWDCSGLTSRLWRDAGGVRSIPRVAADQQAWAVPIPREQLQPADLVFFGQPVTHVALYVADGLVIDASSSRHQVVERHLWTSGVVRYGRVPRPAMPAVRPWTPPPPPAAAPVPVGDRDTPAPDPDPAQVPAPALDLATARAPGLAASQAAALDPELTPLSAWVTVAPLRGLPSPDQPAATAVSRRAIGNARTVLGSSGWSDLALIRVAWRHAGGGVLPASRAALVSTGTPVALNQAHLADLVVYGAPAVHLGLYLGHGFMIDTSWTGRVIVRRVFTNPAVRLVRLPAQ